MTTPDPYGLVLLTQATAFLFSELGKQLDFWRKKKGDKAPQTIKINQSSTVPTVQLDDIEQVVNVQVLLSTRDTINSQLNILREHIRQRNSYAEKLTDTSHHAKEQTWLEGEVSRLNKQIENESGEFQKILESVYGKG